MYFLACLLRCTQMPRGTSSRVHNSRCCKHLQESLLHLFEEHASEHSLPVHQRVLVTVALIEDQGQEATIRVTLVGQEALSTLHSVLHVLSGRPIQACSETSYQVMAFDLTHPQWSAVWGWADLLRPCYNRCIRLQFVSPVQLTSPGTDAWCFPNAHPLFSELLQSWQQLHGPAFSDSVAGYLQEGRCVVSDYRLSLQQGRDKHETSTGLCGSIRYECRTQNMVCITALHALARLAFFTGVGKATRQGMGMIQVQEGRHLS